MMKGIEQDIYVDHESLERCLVPFLDAFGWVGVDRTIREARPHLTSEFDVVGFLNTMANLGFETHIIKKDFEKISDQLLPVMYIDFEGNARVVLKREVDGCLIYDGTSGEYQTVNEEMKGYFFIVHKTSNLHQKVFEPQQNWFFNIAIRFKGVLAVSALISMILASLALFTPALVMGVYDILLVGDSETSHWMLAVGILIFVCAEFFLRMLRYYMMNYTGSRLSNIVNNQVLRRILYLPPSYTETASLGAQVSRIKDFASVKEFIEGNGIIAFVEVPFYMLMIIILVFIAGNLAYVALVAGLLFIIVGSIAGPLVKQINEQAAQSSMNRQEYLIDLINNFHHIKQVGEHVKWKGRYRDYSAEAAYAGFKNAQLNAVIANVSQAIISIAGVITVGLGAYMVIQKELSPGALVASLILVWRILGPVKTAFSVGAQSSRISRSIKQLNRLMAIKIEKNWGHETVLSRSLVGNIKLQNVSIRYSNDAHPALLSVNLEIKAGESVCFTGHDGSGKSTLFKILLAMYKPQAGRVLLDTFNIQQLDPVQVRQSVGYTPQVDTIFYGTIKQNLLLVKPDATAEEMEVAALYSGLWKVMQNESITFDTRLGDNLTKSIQGSIHKLINLTRMFLKDSKIFLMDEPERQLSTDQVEHLAESIIRMNGEKTILLISQNPVLVAAVNKVVHMERGRISSINENKK